MRYKWRIVLQRVEKEKTNDGHEERLINTLKTGFMEEDRSGDNVVIGVMERYKKEGNIIELEVTRIG